MEVVDFGSKPSDLIPVIFLLMLIDALCFAKDAPGEVKLKSEEPVKDANRKSGGQRW